MTEIIKAAKDDMENHRINTGDNILRVIENTDETHIFVAGKKIDVERARQNFTKAKEIFETRLKSQFPDFKWEKLTFEAMAGDIVGEAHEDGRISVDPVILMHPISRMTFAMTIAHELSHDKKNVMNEELAEAWTRVFIPEGTVSSAYDHQKMAEFAKISQLTIPQIWHLYRTANFKQIYNSYRDGYTNGDVSLNEEAMTNFRAFFPELTYTEKPGVWSTKEVEVPEESVVDLAQKRVDQRLAEAA